MSQKLAEVDFLAFENYGEIEGAEKLLEVLNSDIPFPGSVDPLKNDSGREALVRDPFGLLHAPHLLDEQLANQGSHNVRVRLRRSSQNARGLLNIMVVVMK